MPKLNTNVVDADNYCVLIGDRKITFDATMFAAFNHAGRPKLYWAGGVYIRDKFTDERRSLSAVLLDVLDIKQGAAFFAKDCANFTVSTIQVRMFSKGGCGIGRPQTPNFPYKKYTNRHEVVHISPFIDDIPHEILVNVWMLPHIPVRLSLKNGRLMCPDGTCLAAKLLRAYGREVFSGLATKLRDPYDLLMDKHGQFILSDEPKNIKNYDDTLLVESPGCPSVRIKLDDVDDIMDIGVVKMRGGVPLLYLDDGRVVRLDYYILGNDRFHPDANVSNVVRKPYSRAVDRNDMTRILDKQNRGRVYCRNYAPKTFKVAPINVVDGALDYRRESIKLINRQAGVNSDDIQDTTV
jgi:hypothetical protein